MNKLTQIITPYLQSVDYRGIPLYQHSSLVDDLDLISDLFKNILDNNNLFPCKESDLPYKNFCESYGWKTTVPRKNLFPDLEKMGLIYRTSKIKKNWDYISLTEKGLSFLNCSDKRICIEHAHRFRLGNDEKFKEFIDRMEIMVSEVGVLFWWEVWLCMRLDYKFENIKKTIKQIREIYRFKGNKNFHNFTQNVTKDFSAFNKKGKKQNGAIDFDNIINKVTSFGVKASFFFFKVDGDGLQIRFKSSFNTGENRLNRKNKRSSFYLSEGENKSDFEYHHIVPFANVHNNHHLQSMIDDDKNLIPLKKSDHDKFPKMNNSFVKLIVQNSSIKFYCLENPQSYIEIENTKHLNLEKLEKLGVIFNNSLTEKIF